jgi:hypothetical protein
MPPNCNVLLPNPFPTHVVPWYCGVVIGLWPLLTPWALGILSLREITNAIQTIPVLNSFRTHVNQTRPHYRRPQRMLHPLLLP